MVGGGTVVQLMQQSRDVAFDFREQGVKGVVRELIHPVIPAKLEKLSKTYNINVK